MIEIRKNTDGTLDEVVADRCRLQMEQMNDGHWFIEVKGESHPATFKIDLFTKRRAKIHARVEAE